MDTKKLLEIVIETTQKECHNHDRPIGDNKKNAQPIIWLGDIILKTSNFYLDGEL